MSLASFYVRERMLTVADFPNPGVTFRDLTPVFADADALTSVVRGLIEPFEGQFDAIAGLEARGFLLAAAAAVESSTGVLTVRKGGKLPGDLLQETYSLEYGTATLEVNPKILPPQTRVLVVDDVLATGGTTTAAISLIERAGWRVAGVSVVLELEELRGRRALAGRTVNAVLSI